MYTVYAFASFTAHGLQTGDPVNQWLSVTLVLVYTAVIINHYYFFPDQNHYLQVIIIEHCTLANGLLAFLATQPILFLVNLWQPNQKEMNSQWSTYVEGITKGSCIYHWLVDWQVTDSVARLLHVPSQVLLYPSIRQPVNLSDQSWILRLRSIEGYVLTNKLALLPAICSSLSWAYSLCCDYLHPCECSSEWALRRFSTRV
jgi:hypothetical protein